VKVRRPTEFRRTTLSQELTEILPAEADAPPGSYRKVQVLVPDAPQCVYSLDEPTPAQAGPDRTYDLLPLPPGGFTRFNMLPHQRLFGASLAGLAQAGLIVQYAEE
jgi:hypothetical protein